MPERIPYEGATWQQHAGHVKRYEWVNQFIKPNDMVLDVCCGIGYGSEVMQGYSAYTGVDKRGVFWDEFWADNRRFLEADVENWYPDFIPDISVCFETLEHLKDPQRLADILQGITARIICVSVPVIETVGKNEFHLHDFTKESLRQMFDYWYVLEDWEQPSESSHVWAFKP